MTIKFNAILAVFVTLFAESEIVLVNISGCNFIDSGTKNKLIPNPLSASN